MMTALSRTLSAIMIACVPSSMGSDRLPVGVLSEIAQFTPASDWYSLAKTHPYWEIGVNLARNAQFPGYPLSLSDGKNPSKQRSLRLKLGSAELIGDPKPGSFADRYTGDVMVTKIPVSGKDWLTLPSVESDLHLLRENGKEFSVYNLADGTEVSVNLPPQKLPNMILVSQTLISEAEESGEQRNLVIKAVQQNGDLINISSLPLPEKYNPFHIRKGNKDGSLDALILRAKPEGVFELDIFDALSGDSKGSVPISEGSEFSGLQFSNDGTHLLCAKEISDEKSGSKKSIRIRVCRTDNGWVAFDQELNGKVSDLKFSEMCSYMAVAMAESEDEESNVTWIMVDLRKGVWWSMLHRITLEWMSDDLFVVSSDDAFELRMASQLGRIIAENTGNLYRLIEEGTPMPFSFLCRLHYFMPVGLMVNPIVQVIYKLHFQKN